MILFSFKNEPEIRGEHFPCSHFRWTFQVGWDHIGFVHQHKYKSNGKWNDSHTAVYEITIGSWDWGSKHIYYDGPHCIFSLGFIHFIRGGPLWSKKPCKCWPETKVKEAPDA